MVAFVSVASGQPIRKWKIEDVVRSYTKDNDTVYVVNFWATFCKPCIAEIPDFIRIAKQYEKQKVKLLLVSLDLASYYPARIAAFAKKNKYNVPIVWLNETNADHFCPQIDKKWSGSIPSTIVVNNKSGYKKFVEGEMSATDFEMLLKEALGGNALHKYTAPMNEAEILKADAGDVAAGENAFLTFRSADSAVYSIEGGKVNMVARIDNIKVVIIEKEKLFYTYSNLGSTVLKKGDLINADQLIGYAALDLDGHKPTLDLYISNSDGNLLLAKTDFVPRKDKRLLDHSIEPQLQEPK